jgi:hypothetical protein
MAQTKISGTHQCSKPDVEQTMQVGDRPNHSFTISQGKCTCPKPITIEGIQDKERAYTNFRELSGNSSQSRGYNIATMANGDKVHFSYQVTATLNEGVPQNLEAAWTIVGGTGKFTGIKGKGTCKGKSNPDDSRTWECEGEYTLPK